MTHQQDKSIATGEAMKPPLPRWAYAIVNPTMMALLRSPAHGLLSNNLMILIYQGRKSGKRYMIPVGYTQEGNRLYLFSHSTWAKNFQGGAPVAVRLRGKTVRATARIIDDTTQIRDMVERFIRDRGEGMAERMGFLSKGPGGAQQPQIPAGSSFIEIELADGAAA